MRRGAREQGTIGKEMQAYEESENVLGATAVSACSSTSAKMSEHRLSE